LLKLRSSQTGAAWKWSHHPPRFLILVGFEGGLGLQTRASILLADDESAIVTVTKMRLENFGYSVITVLDGDECVKRAKSDKPDLILLDIMMPGVDGFNVLERLKSDEETKPIPIAMFTAQVHPEDMKRAKEMGACDYITKPFKYEELIGSFILPRYFGLLIKSTTSCGYSLRLLSPSCSISYLPRCYDFAITVLLSGKTGSFSSRKK